MRFSSALSSVALIGAALLAAGPSHAQVTGLFNTAVDATGTTVLPVGSVDPHYSFVNGATVTPAIVTNNPAYIQSSSSGYIFNDAAGSLTGTFALRTTFTIVAGDLSTAQVTGSFSVDNVVTNVLINGNSTGISSSTGGFTTFTTFTPFTISSGFQIGTNTIDFVVNNIDGPGALNVNNLTGTISAVGTAAPEPGSLALLIPAGLGVVGMVRRRRK